MKPWQKTLTAYQGKKDLLPQLSRIAGAMCAIESPTPVTGGPPYQALSLLTVLPADVSLALHAAQEDHVDAQVSTTLRFWQA